MSRKPEPNRFSDRHQIAFLLNTPHLGVGLGEWAIMCASWYRIRCSKNASSQKWPDEIQPFINQVGTMQLKLRDRLRAQDTDDQYRSRRGRKATRNHSSDRGGMSFSENLVGTQGRVTIVGCFTTKNHTRSRVVSTFIPLLQPVYPDQVSRY